MNGYFYCDSFKYFVPRNRSLILKSYTLLFYFFFSLDYTWLVVVHETVQMSKSLVNINCNEITIKITYYLAVRWSALTNQMHCFSLKRDLFVYVRSFFNTDLDLFTKLD